MPKEPEYLELPKYFLDRIEKEKKGQPSRACKGFCVTAFAG